MTEFILNPTTINCIALIQLCVIWANLRSWRRVKAGWTMVERMHAETDKMLTNEKHAVVANQLLNTYSSHLATAIAAAVFPKLYEALHH